MHASLPRWGWDDSFYGAPALIGQTPIYILLATCNGARFLPALLDSLLDQIDPHWIIVARDDGSDDDTISILEHYATRDHRVLVLRDISGRLGVRGNFERLLAQAVNAGAELFALCDQDDIWFPDKIARMRAAMLQGAIRHGPAVPLVAYADLALIDITGQTIANSHFERAGGGQVRAGVDFWLLAHNLIPGCAMFGNRALLARALPFPTQVFHHDWWLAVVAAASGHVMPVGATLTGYRQHPDNVIGAASPASRVVMFLRRFGPSLAEARNQYKCAVDQATALLERLGDDGHGEWRAAALAVRDRLRARRRLSRLLAVVAGPVRRLGFARNVLMFAVALFDPGCPVRRARYRAR
jgi:glycosyltransferase involved in cell wall biosynthesis